VEHYAGIDMSLELSIHRIATLHPDNSNPPIQFSYLPLDLGDAPHPTAREHSGRSPARIAALPPHPSQYLYVHVLRCASANSLDRSVSATSFMRRSSFGIDRRGISGRRLGFQTENDRRAAEQRDERAPFYVGHGPLALPRRNHQYPDRPEPSAYRILSLPQKGPIGPWDRPGSF
jgi:hypothetical protein